MSINTVSGLLEPGQKMTFFSNELIETSRDLDNQSKEGVQAADLIHETSRLLNSSFQTTLDDISDTLNNVDDTNELIKIANQKTSSLLQSVTTLGKQLTNIQDITQKMQELSSQTRMLALNASVEAAKAGQVGVGFAVVADEVKNLAQMSSVYARETEQSIKGFTDICIDGQKRTKDVAKAFSKINRTLDTINASHSKLKGIVHKDKQEVMNVLKQSEKLREVLKNTERHGYITNQQGLKLKNEVTHLKENLMTIAKDLGGSFIKKDPYMAAQLSSMDGTAIPKEVFRFNLTINMPLMAMILRDKRCKMDLVNMYTKLSAPDYSIQPHNVFTQMECCLNNLCDLDSSFSGFQHFEGKVARPSDVLLISILISRCLKNLSHKLDCKKDFQFFQGLHNSVTESAKREIFPSDIYHLALILKRSSELLTSKRQKTLKKA